MIQQALIREFEKRFGGSPAHIVRSPGRVNLIGDHTDYNDGFVLPMAIDRAIWLALRPRADRRVLVYSLEESRPAEFSLAGFERSSEGWVEYVKGLTAMLLEAGHGLIGWEGVLTSDVPVGSGLSSSAALEMAVAFAYSVVSDFAFDGVAMARLGQRAENEWVGAMTGVMDQMISANGIAGSALLIDCRDLSIESVSVPDGMEVVVMDTRTRHSHATSGYNDRRKDCERAAGHFGVERLRDLSAAKFASGAAGLDETAMRRARHVLSENARVLTAVQAMKAGDANWLGKLMNESHASLRDEFEVTNVELDVMTTIAVEQPGCLGARMTGGGFGGCVVALVLAPSLSEFEDAVAKRYEAATDLKPDLFVVRASAGTGLAAANQTSLARSLM